eukprot:m.66536 g.66536  ORF g.66536 m.66536 type:complete len:468 (-) comp14060_c0_seq1:56-1459(-)
MASRVGGLVRLQSLSSAFRSRTGHVAAARAVAVAQRSRQLHLTAAACKKIDFLLADVGEGIAEVEVLSWSIEEGDTIAQFDPVCDVQSDKATVDITSRYDGVVTKLYYDVGEIAKVGSPLMQIDVEGEVDDEVEATNEEPSSSSSSVDQSTPAQAGSTTKVLTTPAVRRMVREHDLDLSVIPGTGKEGRVLKEDVIAFMEGGQPSPQSPTPDQSQAATPSPTPVPVREPIVALAQDVVEPIRGMQKAMVKSMTAALQVPHFGYADEVEMDALMGVRQSLKPQVEAMGLKLSFMPFIIKAFSLALQEFPLLNSHVNDDCSEIIKRASHNICVAMDTPQGLVVPNIKDVQLKSVLDIAQDLNRLQALGKEGKIGQAELTGGTFSLSNIGNVGGTYLNPVVVVPQVAIAAIGKVRRLPRFDDDDNVQAVNLMNVSFSADHRVVDGVTVAKFSNRVKGLLEDPASMLLQLR